MKITFNQYKKNMAQFNVVDIRLLTNGKLTITYALNLSTIEFTKFSADAGEYLKGQKWKEVEPNKWVATITEGTENDARIANNKISMATDLNCRITTAQGKIKFAGTGHDSWFTLPQARLKTEEGDRIFQYNKEGQQLWEIF